MPSDGGKLPADAPAGVAGESPTRNEPVASFLRRNQEEILSSWEEAVRELPSARAQKLSKRGLPALRRISEAQGPEQGKAAEGEAASARVLVVDDNADLAETLAEFLTLLDYTVKTAADGIAALEVARSFEPGVVLLDIGLPRMSGYDVARRLREEHGQRMVLVAMTGYGQNEDRRRAFAAGFDHHLVKPVDPNALHQLLSRARPHP